MFAAFNAQQEQQHWMYYSTCYPQISVRATRGRPALSLGCRWEVARGITDVTASNVGIHCKRAALQMWSSPEERKLCNLGKNARWLALFPCDRRKDSSWLDWNCPCELMHALILNHWLAKPSCWLGVTVETIPTLIFIDVLLWLALMASHWEPGFC